MSYNRKAKPGNLRIWSSHRGSILTPDPIKNGNSALLEFWSMLWRQGSIYESNHVDFALINDNDLFSLFAAIQMVKAGKGCSFKNEAGRLISFSQEKVTDKANDVILIKIEHKAETGIMTRKEIDELEIVTRQILAKLNYTDPEIAEQVSRLMARSQNQENESSNDMGVAKTDSA